MKYTLICTAVLLLMACSPGLSNYYRGSVVNAEGKPVTGAHVFQRSGDNLSVTNALGRFKLPKTSLNDIIIMAEGYQPDTIHPVWTMHGEVEKYTPLLSSDTSRIFLKPDGRTRLQIVISFSSECCGPAPAQGVADAIKQNVQTQQLKGATLVSYAWGKEGEADYVLTVPNLSHYQMGLMMRAVEKAVQKAQAVKSNAGDIAILPYDAKKSYRDTGNKILLY